MLWSVILNDTGSAEITKWLSVSAKLDLISLDFLERNSNLRGNYTYVVHLHLGNPAGDRFIFSSSKLFAGTGKHLDAFRVEVYERWHFRGQLPKENSVIQRRLLPSPSTRRHKPTSNLSSKPSGSSKERREGKWWSYWWRSECTISAVISKVWSISACMPTFLIPRPGFFLFFPPLLFFYFLTPGIRKESTCSVVTFTVLKSWQTQLIRVQQQQAEGNQRCKWPW